VVVDDPHSKHNANREAKADPPLVIDSNAPLSGAVSDKLFKAVGRNSQHDEAGRASICQCVEDNGIDSSFL
jgi:hypothetical protein